MNSRNSAFRWKVALPLFALTLTCSAIARAQTYKVLHHFGAPGDGAQPVGALVFGQDGKLYGTTSGGGPGMALCGLAGCGTVFELAPNPDGSWSETVLHNFSGPDGSGASFEAPVFDTEGNLYGTTGYGGTRGYGTVFELIRGSDGGWSFSSLYSFQDASDGWNPSGITFHNGIVYGTTSWGGGENDQGVVFSVSKLSFSNWLEQSLHRFNVNSDGWLPSGLVFDADGNAYGTTFYGGPPYGCGTVYKLTQDRMTQRWTESILYTFQCGNDGANPSSTLVFDSVGNLYSTTAYGGPGGYGTVFELTPNPNGTWTENVIYAFQDTAIPYAGVTFDQSGNLYGVTFGTNTVYKLTSSGGQWTQTVLHRFNGFDGADPFANVILDSAGNIYGTTQLGGEHGEGVVFEITQ